MGARRMLNERLERLRPVAWRRARRRARATSLDIDDHWLDSLRLDSLPPEWQDDDEPTVVLRALTTTSPIPVVEDEVAPDGAPDKGTADAANGPAVGNAATPTGETTPVASGAKVMAEDASGVSMAADRSDAESVAAAEESDEDGGRVGPMVSADRAAAEHVAVDPTAAEQAATEQGSGSGDPDSPLVGPDGSAPAGGAPTVWPDVFRAQLAAFTTGDLHPAEMVAANVLRASEAIEALRSELSEANAWAQQTRTFQMSEQQIGHLLLAAKRAADKAVGEAESRAAEIVEAAEARAREIVAAAYAEAAGILVPAPPRALEPLNDAAGDLIETITTDARELHDVLSEFARTNSELTSEISMLARALAASSEHAPPVAEDT